MVTPDKIDTSSGWFEELRAEIGQGEGKPDYQLWRDHDARIATEVLAYVANNPIDLTEKDAKDLRDIYGKTSTSGFMDIRAVASEFQRIAFLKKEPVVLPEMYELAAKHHWLGNQEGNSDRLPRLLQEACEIGKQLAKADIMKNGCGR